MSHRRRWGMRLKRAEEDRLRKMSEDGRVGGGRDGSAQEQGKALASSRHRVWVVGMRPLGFLDVRWNLMQSLLGDSRRQVGGLLGAVFELSTSSLSRSWSPSSLPSGIPIPPPYPPSPPSFASSSSSASSIAILARGWSGDTNYQGHGAAL